MNTITIPKKMVARDDLVIIPRKEYEALLEFKKFKEFSPTVTQKKALARAERNFKKGNYTTLKKLRHELEFDSR